MKKIKRLLKWISITCLVLFIGLAVLINVIDFSLSDDEISSAFQGLDFEPSTQIFTHENNAIHYVSIGDTSKPMILFVHGSPGSWDNFIGFLSNPYLLKDFRIVSVDRPGFGKSAKGTPERSLAKQASSIAEILTREHKKAILIGHSYGGPVITKLAIDYPELVEGLVIVAGSVDPDLEKNKWYQIPFRYKVLSWILPSTLYVANEEILALKKELELMKKSWAKITCPVSIIQGGEDTLVPKENATYAKQMLINAPVKMVEIPSMNHFVPWEHPKLIETEVIRINNLITKN